MLPKTGREFPPAGGDYAAAIGAALRSELGDGHRAAKTVMRWTGASERSAKGWLSGKTGPSGPHLISLARKSDAVTRTLLRLADRKHLETGLQIHTARNILAAAVQLLDGLID